MSASRLRLENLSIFNYMKYEVIAPEFSELTENEPLVYSAASGAYFPDTTLEPLPTSTGRGWVFFDDYIVGTRRVVDTSQEQTGRVSVSGASTYTINYLTGAITNPDAVPTDVSYYWNYVSVIPEWPGVNPPPLPFVSMGIDSRKKDPFQLGGGVRNLSTVYFYVFASSASERDDISEAIYNGIYERSIVISDFSGGGYLKYDGTYNTSRVHPPPDFGRLIFIEIDHKNIHSPDDFIDLNKYRSVISGTYESFMDS